MLDSLLKNLLKGITLIEDDYGAVNKIISKQLGDYASISGKTVCFLEPPESNVSIASGYSDNSFEIPYGAIQNAADNFVLANGLSAAAAVSAAASQSLPQGYQDWETFR